jgi:hypothetical protein
VLIVAGQELYLYLKQNSSFKTPTQTLTQFTLEQGNSAITAKDQQLPFGGLSIFSLYHEQASLCSSKCLCRKEFFHLLMCSSSLKGIIRVLLIPVGINSVTESVAEGKHGMVFHRLFVCVMICWQNTMPISYNIVFSI